MAQERTTMGGLYSKLSPITLLRPGWNNFSFTPDTRLTQLWLYAVYLLLTLGKIEENSKTIKNKHHYKVNDRNVCKRN